VLQVKICDMLPSHGAAWKPDFCFIRRYLVFQPPPQLRLHCVHWCQSENWQGIVPLTGLPQGFVMFICPVHALPPL